MFRYFAQETPVIAEMTDTHAVLWYCSVACVQGQVHDRSVCDSDFTRRKSNVLSQLTMFLQNAAVHHDLQTGSAGTIRGFLVVDPFLHPDHLRSDRDC